MKLIFDARYIRTDFHDGLSRYSTELAREVAKIDPTVSFLICDQAQAALLPDGATTIQFHAPTSPLELVAALRLNRYQPDVVFSPLQSMSGMGRRFKLILTQQDMTYYKIKVPPRDLPWHVRLGWKLYHLSYWPGRIALRNADLMATVSQASRQEILDAGLTNRSVIVVPNAPEDLSRYISRPSDRTTPPRNLIYMGAFYPHKNVETLIAMMAALPDYTLHLLSRVPPARKRDLLTHATANTNIVFHDGVSDESYAQLLSDDAIMVSASRSEGYGLPVVEALQLGTPAVITDMPVFHEVAGPGALYADPDNPSDFVKKIRQLDDQATRAQLSRDGQNHIEKFSWEKSARALHDAAKNIVGAS